MIAVVMIVDIDTPQVSCLISLSCIHGEQDEDCWYQQGLLHYYVIRYGLPMEPLALLSVFCLHAFHIGSIYLHEQSPVL